ncbi:hypothetical protein HDU93_009597 [Gonapodya sp. JEL0774]|nr:hypothetical protein HDU93_009597 [Gonapodya sp. JEL0774]
MPAGPELLPSMIASPTETEYKCAAFARTAPFKYLPRTLLREIASASSLVSYPVGAVIARKGDTTKDVFIICTGHVHRDYHDGKAGSLLGAGTFFGDRAPLFNEPRRVTFTAVRSASGGGTRSSAPPLAQAASPGAHSRIPSMDVAVVLLVMPGEVFIDLVMTQLPFSVALARMLRTRQHLFAPLDAFQSYLFFAVSSRSPTASGNMDGLSPNLAAHSGSATIDFKTLCSYYKEMKPAVHGGVNDGELDTGAWLYAVRRLPTNITAVSTIVMSTKMLGILDQAYSLSDGLAQSVTSAYNAGLGRVSTVSASALASSADAPPGPGIAPAGLTDAPPPTVSELGARAVLLNVKTSARRRTTIVLMHGKIFVLLRDATTDLLDFTTCLCLHTIELQKLRYAILYESEAIVALRDAVDRIYGKQGLGAGGPNPSPPTPYAPTREPRDVQLEVLSGFSKLREVDVDGLLRMWPDDALWNVWNVVFHHGDYSVFVDRALDSYDADISEAWIDKVAALTNDLMGEWSEADLDVDIISSNTHSVINILSPFLHARRDEILGWGRKYKKDVVEANPVGDQDLLYILAQFYFRDPALAKERVEVERSSGIRTLVEEVGAI